MEKIELSKDELAQIKGGNKKLSSIGSEDKDNTNAIDNCLCWYSNNSNLTNDNQVSLCTCACR